MWDEGNKQLTLLEISSAVSGLMRCQQNPSFDPTVLWVMVVVLKLGMLLQQILNGGVNTESKHCSRVV